MTSQVENLRQTYDRTYDDLMTNFFLSFGHSSTRRLRCQQRGVQNIWGVITDGYEKSTVRSKRRLRCQYRKVLTCVKLLNRVAKLLSTH